jgi:hypothetical protein
MKGEPPFDTVDGVTLSKATLEKTFTGTIVGTSTVHMLAARTPVEQSAGYVALERIRCTIDGREGTFALLHIGLMNRGERALTVRIVPDSGTGGLAQISGSMDIRIVDKKHHYEIDYELPT